MNINLIKLDIKNFKGCRKRVVEFNGLDTSIYGDNATGKTTIYDAFSWLLFDKNHEGNKSFLIKPIGAERPEVTVEGVIDVDGTRTTFKKVLTETWTKKRGEEQETFTGHSTAYWINKIPKKAGEYKAYIDAIVTESTFKQLTSASYFLSLKKGEQRKVLVDMIGTASEEEIAGEDSNLQGLVNRMQDDGYSVDDLLKLAKQNVTLYNNEQKNIGPRIDEVKRNIPDMPKNFEELKKGLEEGKKYIADIDKKLTDAKEKAARLAALYQTVSNSKAKLEILRQEKLQEVNAEYIECKTRLDEFKQEKSITKAKEETAKQRLSGATSQKETHISRLDELRKEYTETRDIKEEWEKREFVNLSTDENCEYCGQELPKGKLEDINKQAQAVFEKKKAEKIADATEKMKVIVTNGNIVKTKKEYQELEETKAKEEVEKYQAEQKSLASKIKLLEDKLEKAEKVDEIDITEQPEYNDTYKAMTAAQAELEDINNSKDTEELITQRDTVSGQIERIQELINNKDVIEKSEKRIEELKARGKELAGLIAQEKAIQYSCERYIRRKAEILQNNINDLFDNLEFRLFQEQINGGIQDDCTAMINGVEYESASHSEQIRANMDIVNAMQKAEDTFCPVFVDNAEAATHFRNMNCQVIKLYVSEQDKDIRVETKEKEKGD